MGSGSRQLQWRWGYTFAYRAVFTQSDVAGGSVVVDVARTDQELEYEIDSIVLGPDDYAAGRQVDIFVLDEDDNRVATLMTESRDNQRLAFPAKDHTTDQEEMLSSRNYMVSGTDYLFLRAQSLVQDETFTVTLRLRLKNNELPAIGRSQSGGTVNAPTVTINRIL